MRAGSICKLAAGLGLGLAALAAPAKDSKPPVPAWILQARTVAVMVDPDTGVSLKDTSANQTAQKDVERALANWGRFQTALGPQQADLVIVIRRGSGKIADETVSEPRQNSRAGVINPAQDGVVIGAQHGPQPGLSSGRADDGTVSPQDRAHPQVEMGRTDDSFEVYQGQVDHPMDAPPGWRWVRKDGLHAHDVPAVAEFRKAIAEAEKKAAQQAGKHP